MSFVVFWLEQGTARYESYGEGRLGDALARCEALRRAAADGALVGHVCISSELTNDRTKRGVMGPPPGYAWTKRRRPTR